MYLQYLRAMGWGYSIIVFVVYFIQNVAFIGQNLWLSDWTNDAMRYNNSEYPASVRDTRVGVFGALGVAQGMSLVCFFISFILNHFIIIVLHGVRKQRIILFFRKKDTFRCQLR